MDEIKNNNAYVFIFVQGFFLEKNFFIACTEKMSARDILKTIDQWKKTLDTYAQERLQIHAWGQYEFDMVAQSGIELTRLETTDQAIKQIRVLLG